MRALFVGSAATVLAFGCQDIVGITELPEAGSVIDSGSSDGLAKPGVCTRGTEILVTDSDLDSVRAGGGSVFGQIPLAGLVTCSSGGVCVNPKNFLSLTASDIVQDYAVGARVHYTLQSGPNFGSVHSVALDGTGDQVELAQLAYPAWVATSGARTFWVDDASTVTTSMTPAVVHCIGCSGGDAAWITGLNATSGLVADANDVYVLTDDGSNTFRDGIFGCAVTAPCGASPRTVALALTTSRTAFTSDGTNVYVARQDVADLVRIDPSGKATSLATGVDIVAVAVDPATAQLYFISRDGQISFVKTDGSAGVVGLSSCNTGYGSVDSIAIDASNLYVLLDLTGGGDAVFSIPRQ